MAHLEDADEQINQRIGSREEDVRGLRNELTSQMSRQFFWLLLGLLLVSTFLPTARGFGH
jgi:hypothetical protein